MHGLVLTKQTQPRQPKQQNRFAEIMLAGALVSSSAPNLFDI
jgi:hypothetical protein